MTGRRSRDGGETEQRWFTLKCTRCRRTKDYYMKLSATCGHCGATMVDAEYYHWVVP